MAKILHFVSADDMPHRIMTSQGPHKAVEYIVITDDDSGIPLQENKVAGFVFYKEYEIEDTGTLPTERILIP